MTSTSASDMQSVNNAGPSVLQNHTGSIVLQNHAGSYILQNHAGSYILQNNTGSHVLQNNTGYSFLQNQAGSNVLQNHTRSYALQNHTGSIVLQNHPRSHVLQNLTGSHVLQNHAGTHVLQNHAGYHVLQNHAGSHVLQNHAASSVVQNHTGSHVLQNHTGSHVLQNHAPSSVLQNHAGSYVLQNCLEPYILPTVTGNQSLSSITSYLTSTSETDLHNHPISHLPQTNKGSKSSDCKTPSCKTGAHSKELCNVRHQEFPDHLKQRSEFIHESNMLTDSLNVRGQTDMREVRSHMPRILFQRVNQSVVQTPVFHESSGTADFQQGAHVSIGNVNNHNPLLKNSSAPASPHQIASLPRLIKIRADHNKNNVLSDNNILLMPSCNSAEGVNSEHNVYNADCFTSPQNSTSLTQTTGISMQTENFLSAAQSSLQGQSTLLNLSKQNPTNHSVLQTGSSTSAYLKSLPPIKKTATSGQNRIRMVTVLPNSTNSAKVPLKTSYSEHTKQPNLHLNSFTKKAADNVKHNVIMSDDVNADICPDNLILTYISDQNSTRQTPDLQSFVNMATLPKNNTVKVPVESPSCSEYNKQFHSNLYVNSFTKRPSDNVEHSCLSVNMSSGVNARNSDNANSDADTLFSAFSSGSMKSLNVSQNLTSECNSVSETSSKQEINAMQIENYPVPCLPVSNEFSQDDNEKCLQGILSDDVFSCLQEILSDDFFFKCGVCTKQVFTSHLSLLGHLELQHFDLEVMKCPYCTNYVKTSRFIAHMTAAHRESSKKMLPCGSMSGRWHCQMMTNLSSELERHMTLSHTLKDVLVCPICEFSSLTISAYIDHVRSSVHSFPLSAVTNRKISLMSSTDCMTDSSNSVCVDEAQAVIVPELGTGRKAKQLSHGCASVVKTSPGKHADMSACISKCDLIPEPGMDTVYFSNSPGNSQQRQGAVVQKCDSSLNVKNYQNITCLPNEKPLQNSHMKAFFSNEERKASETPLWNGNTFSYTDKPVCDPSSYSNGTEQQMNLMEAKCSNEISFEGKSLPLMNTLGNDFIIEKSVGKKQHRGGGGSVCKDNQRAAGVLASSSSACIREIQTDASKKSANFSHITEMQRVGLSYNIKNETDDLNHGSSSIDQNFDKIKSVYTSSSPEMTSVNERTLKENSLDDLLRKIISENVSRCKRKLKAAISNLKSEPSDVKKRCLKPLSAGTSSQSTYHMLNAKHRENGADQSKALWDLFSEALDENISYSKGQKSSAAVWNSSKVLKHEHSIQVPVDVQKSNSTRAELLKDYSETAGRHEYLQYHCIECDYKGTCLLHFQIHVAQHANGSAHLVPAVASASHPRCRTCGYYAANHKDYKVHRKYHDLEKRFLCGYCCDDYHSGDDVRKHISEHHKRLPLLFFDRKDLYKKMLQEAVKMIHIDPVVEITRILTAESYRQCLGAKFEQSCLQVSQ